MDQDETTNRLTDHIRSTAHERTSPVLRPKDAATLVVVDRRAPEPKVLMGRRHASLKFMPGKFVFPGGRIESEDRAMTAAGALPDRIVGALAQRVVRASTSKSRALALCAIRETYEETGLLIGTSREALPEPRPRPSPWSAFQARGIVPDLSAIHFIGRAITPPGRPRRFDTRFFSVDREAISAEEHGFVGPDKELVELAWVDLAAARRLDLPPITVVMLDELELRIANGFGHDLPVPFYYAQRGRFVREEL